MKIAIIADLHDQLMNLDKFLKYCLKNKIKKILCLGDVTSEETISYFARNFSGDIFLVRGNAELYDEKILEEFPNIKNCQEIASKKFGQLNIIFFHEPEKLKKAPLDKIKADFVFYGHTHKPWLEKKENYFFVNPGNLGGLYYDASFAVLDTKTKDLKLKIIHRIED